jgi:hypothetical protein
MQAGSVPAGSRKGTGERDGRRCPDGAAPDPPSCNLPAASEYDCADTRRGSFYLDHIRTAARAIELRLPSPPRRCSAAHRAELDLHCHNEFSYPVQPPWLRPAARLIKRRAKRSWELLGPNYKLSYARGRTAHRIARLTCRSSKPSRARGEEAWVLKSRRLYSAPPVPPLRATALRPGASRRLTGGTAGLFDGLRSSGAGRVSKRARLGMPTGTANPVISFRIR